MIKLDSTTDFMEKLKKIKYAYNGKLPIGIEHYYGDILKGLNLNMYAEMYSLSPEELVKYARICNVLKIYEQIIELMELIEIDVNRMDEEIDSEIEEMMNSLQNEGEEMLGVIELNNTNANDENSYPSDNISLVIYPSYIEESKQRTVNAHSGREEQVQKGVATLLERMSKIDYQNLRTKGYVHQINLSRSDSGHVAYGPSYVDRYAFERITSNDLTKVNYVRVPVSQKNRQTIKEEFNMDFDTLYLVVSYGDFINEGISEQQFYNQVYLDLQRHKDEVLSIIDVFRIDFTPKTASIAKSLITEGFKITTELLAAKKDKQSGM